MDLRVFLLALAVALTDCGISSVPTQPYVPVSASHSEDPQTLTERIVEMARDREWKVASADTLRGRVVAVETSLVDGTLKRVTWTFTVGSSSVTVSRFMSLRQPGDDWVPSPDYTYVVEKGVLGEILGRDVSSPQ